MVISGSGPQFVSDTYAKFAREYGFDRFTGNPHYPQCNGEAERAIQMVKSLLRKSCDPFLAILQSGFSPVELLMSRKLWMMIPSVWEQRRPKVVDMTVFTEKKDALKESQRDSCHGITDAELRKNNLLEPSIESVHTNQTCSKSGRAPKPLRRLDPSQQVGL